MNITQLLLTAKFPKRTPKTCNWEGKITSWVSWPMQLRIWLRLPCPRCGKRGWLFSCRYEKCAPIAPDAWRCSDGFTVDDHEYMVGRTESVIPGQCWCRERP